MRVSQLAEILTFFLIGADYYIKKSCNYLGCIEREMDLKDNNPNIQNAALNVDLV